MSNTKNDGGPAFPCEVREMSKINDGRSEIITNRKRPGMTLRDYFAAKAMHALMTNPNNGPSLDFAKYAYAYADLMIKAREQ